MPELINTSMAAFYVGTQLILISTVITLAVKFSAMATKLDGHIAKWDGKNAR